MDNTNTRASAIVAIVLVIAATSLGVFAAGDNVIVADVRIAQGIQQWQGNLPRMLEHLGDMSGETLMAIGVVVGGLGMAALLNQWRLVVFLVVVGFLRLAASLLKPIFASPRPGEDAVMIRDVSDGFGYPSGHSMTAAMIATIVVVLVWNTPRTARLRWFMTGVAVAWMVLVGWSRIWSGAHWPTDVLGGWSYGVALVLLAWVSAATVVRSGIGSRWQR